MQRDSFDDDRSAIQIRIKGDESATPLLIDTTNFLYDFNVAYEIARLATDRRYEQFRFSHYVFFRNGRPLSRPERLKVIRLREESPLELLAELSAVTVGALTAVWLLIQIIEKAYNLKLNRRKLRAEVEKLERDNKISAKEARRAIDDLEQHGLSHLPPDAATAIEGATKRLTRTLIKIEKIELIAKRPNDHDE